MSRLLQIDEQFPISVEYQFSNHFTELADGRSYVIADWEQPLAEFDVSRAKFDQDMRDYLVQFFDEFTANTFLYLDPCDHFCNDYEYEPQSGIFTVGELFPISATEFQLCKVYRAGGLNSVRPIARPVEDEDFRINSSTSHVVNFDTGIVTFSEAPQEQAIKWQGKFLVPCQLIEQNITYQIVSNTVDYSLPGLIFKEVRETDKSFNSPNRPQTISAELDLDLIVGSQVTTTKKISPVHADSGWYKAAPLWLKTKTSYVTAQKTIAYEDDVEAAIAIWRVTCGGAISFKYQGKKVQVKDTPLSLTAESDFSFGIGSLNLVETEGSLLDNLDSETYIQPIIDISGSLSHEIPAIQKAIAELRPLVQASVFGGSQELVDKYFKQIINLSDERWLDWLSRDYRDDPSEPDKLVILIWINESNPVYQVGTDYSPTAIYSADMTSFLESYIGKEVFSAVVYAVRYDGPEFIPFKNHLTAAYEGTDGYEPPIKDYPITIRPDLPANTPASFYLQDLFTGNPNDQTAKFLCRAWSIERKSLVVEQQQDFSTVPIMPFVPEELPSAYLAWIYGSYESTRQEGPFDRGCGDLGYWRTKVAVNGENFVIDDEGRNDVYYVRGVNFERDNPWRSNIIPISDADYESRTTSDLSGLSLRRGQGCNTGSQPFGANAQILDIVPLESQMPVSPQQVKAFFKLGQCEGVQYGFKASWTASESLVVGAVTGKITNVRVYLHKEGSATSNNPRVYALSVDDSQGNTHEPIIILKPDGQYLTYEEAPGGIFNITAVRLDELPDECGNLYDSEASQLSSDSSILGFTNHDCIVSFDGVNYSPRFGGDAQAREHTEELSSSNNTQTTFIFSSEAISTEDLLDGVYSEAQFTEWLVDWNNPENRIKLATGYLGRTTTYHSNEGGLSFRVEMRSLLSRIQQKSYFITVKLCPKTYGKQGEGNCRHNTFGFVDYLEITEVVDAVSFKVNGTRTEANFYGKVTFKSGSRAGIIKLVDSYDVATNTITLRNSIKGLAVGDKLEALALCDHTLKTCTDRNNAVNFGGFWHVPGADKTRRVE